LINIPFQVPDAIPLPDVMCQHVDLHVSGVCSFARIATDGHDKKVDFSLDGLALGPLERRRHGDTLVYTP
jgi:hypothetical protein